MKPESIEGIDGILLKQSQTTNRLPLIVPAKALGPVLINTTVIVIEGIDHSYGALWKQSKR